MPEKEPKSSQIPVFIAGNAILVAGVLIVLMLAVFSVSIGYWLLGAAMMTLGMFLRRTATYPPKYLKITYVFLDSLGSTLLFLDCIVLISFVASWVAAGSGTSVRFDALIWAGALTIMQVIISKFENRFAPQKPVAKRRLE